MVGSRAVVRDQAGSRSGRGNRGSRLVAVSAAVLAAVLMAGCASRVVNRAPVEDRGTGTTRPAPLALDTSAPVAKPPPGAENAGKPDYYTVKPGDTMIRIGLDTGQNWRDIVRWSGVENPNQIEVGQVLRIAPPVAGTVVATAPATATAAAAATASASATASAAGAVAKPVTSSSASPAPVPPVVPAGAASAARPAAAASAPSTPSASAPAPAAASASAPAAAGNADDEIAWIWPSGGGVLAGFDEVKNKGLDIGGTAGEAVVAAADGRVVYVGAGLRGYGNLIILKHNNTYLTAYAHNQTLLVKEDQSVRKGQKIAEMGNSDADRVKLHFEVRRQGKPVDPAKYLPPR